MSILKPSFYIIAFTSPRTLTMFMGVVALHYHCVLSITECHNYHKHGMSPLTKALPMFGNCDWLHLPVYNLNANCRGIVGWNEKITAAAPIQSLLVVGVVPSVYWALSESSIFD